MSQNTFVEEFSSMESIGNISTRSRSGGSASNSNNPTSMANHASRLSEMLGISEEATEDLDRFVKSQRIKEWVKQFRRSDPRYQILNFFNDVAQEGASEKLEVDVFDPIKVSPLLRAFYRSSVFTVWRPTSYDAIRRMILGEGVGKGLDIKGKSAKQGKLSGFVPFLQISKEEHKKEIRTLSKDGRLRVFYHTEEHRETVLTYLEEVRDEMDLTVRNAKVIVENNDTIGLDDDTVEWFLERLIWDMTDSSSNRINLYTPKKWGIDVPERLFWEACVIRQNIDRQPGSEDDVGRPSEPNFQNMNFAALRQKQQQSSESGGGEEKKQQEYDRPRPVITHYVDPNDRNPNPLNPKDLLMAYEDHGRVMPVVSDFDCFLIGTRGVQYKEPIPDDQLEVCKWCIDQIESILDGQTTASSWTSRWLDVLKTAASKGFHPTIPPLGFSDPKTNNIMKHAIHRLRKDGAVRHGAECFNFYFPQELDDEFLVISDVLSGQTLPWKYVDQDGLLEVLKEKIEQGYTFPINPKWILCDKGWIDVFNLLRASNAANVQNSLKVWYPQGTGIIEKIETIHSRHPNGFVRHAATDGKEEHRFDDADGTAAMDLAELELKYYLTLQRVKRKLRGFLIWRRLLFDTRKRKQQNNSNTETATGGEPTVGGETKTCESGDSQNNQQHDDISDNVVVDNSNANTETEGAAGCKDESVVEQTKE